MNYIEALQQLVDGKKIREKNWDKGEYVYILEDLILSEIGLPIDLTIDDIADITKDNWELYQTEEEKLITDGKKWKINNVCKGMSCSNCVIKYPDLHKVCTQFCSCNLHLNLELSTDDEIDKLYEMVKGEIK